MQSASGDELESYGVADGIACVSPAAAASKCVRRAPSNPSSGAPRAPLPAPRSPSRARRAKRLRGDLRRRQSSFTAKESFEAILDTSSGPFFGGGGQVNLPLNLFARVDVTRFKKDGERAFVSNGQVFKLGIPTTITVMPIEFTGGYRREFAVRPPRAAEARLAPEPGFRIIPFAGGGAASSSTRKPPTSRSRATMWTRASRAITSSAASKCRCGSSWAWGGVSPSLGAGCAGDGRRVRRVQRDRPGRRDVPLPGDRRVLT